jgi:cytoskeleton protein RodZ
LVTEWRYVDADRPIVGLTVFLRTIKPPLTKPERGAPAFPGANPIGDVLRQQREALRLGLSEVAAALKIKVAYLVALEAGHPEQLPGPVYAIGFLRAYANHLGLGLDADEILRRFKEDPGAYGGKPDLAFPMPLGERSMPGSGIVLVAAILGFCGYGVWYYLSTAEPSRPPRVAEVPAELLRQKPQAPAETLAATPISTPEAPAPAETPNASFETTTSPVAPANQTAALAAVPPPQDATATTGAPARIELHAIADSWIEITDARRAVLLARILKAGETYDVPDRPGLSMRTGNAGGLAITVDGNPTPSIGPMGAVRRNVVLEPEALSSGAATRP